MSDEGKKQEEASAPDAQREADREAVEHAKTFCERYVALRRVTNDNRSIVHWVCDQRSHKACKKVRDALKVYCRKYGAKVTQKELIRAVLAWNINDEDVELAMALASVLDNWSHQSYSAHILLCILELAAVIVLPSSSKERPSLHAVLSDFAKFVKPDNSPEAVRTKFMLVMEYAKKKKHAVLNRAVQFVESNDPDGFNSLVLAVSTLAPQLEPFKSAWKDFCALVQPHMQHVYDCILMRDMERSRLNIHV